MRAEVVVITFPVYGQGRIQKIDPQTGRVLATIPAPSGGGHSGVAWAERRLWVGQYHDRKIHQVDPETGAVLRTIETSRYVTGVAWNASALTCRGRKHKPPCPKAGC